MKNEYRYSANGKVYFVCPWCHSYEVLGGSTVTVVHQHEGAFIQLLVAKTKGEAVAMCKGRSKTKQTAKTHGVSI